MRSHEVIISGREPVCVFEGMTSNEEVSDHTSPGASPLAIICEELAGNKTGRLIQRRKMNANLRHGSSECRQGGKKWRHLGPDDITGRQRIFRAQAQEKV